MTNIHMRLQDVHCAHCRSHSCPCLVRHAAGCGGGILLYEFGTAEVGLAAAGYAARAQDASTAFTNPPA